MYPKIGEFYFRVRPEEVRKRMCGIERIGEQIGTSSAQTEIKELKYLDLSGFIIAVGAIVRTKNGKFVFVRQKYLPSLWQSPGGGVYRRETILEAVVREVKEETGLDSRVCKLNRVWIASHEYKILGMKFIVEATGGKLMPMDPDGDTIEAKAFERKDVPVEKLRYQEDKDYLEKMAE